MKQLPKVLLISLGVLVILLLFPPPCDPDHINVTHILKPPSTKFWLGTDHLGRDNFSRSFVALKHSLFLVAIAEGLSLVAGLLAGAATGWRLNKKQFRPSRIFDMELFFRVQPLLLMLFCLVALLREYRMGEVVALAIFSAMYGLPFYRREFSHAFASPWFKGAFLSGAGAGHLIGKIIFPMVSPGILRYAILDMASLVAFEGLLGMTGLTNPALPSLGRMLYDGRSFLVSAPWLFIAPAGLLAIVIICAIMFSNVFYCQISKGHIRIN